MTPSLDFTTTHVGSYPHKQPVPLVESILSNLDIPVWPQLPRRDFRESIYVQYSAALPGIVIDEAREKAIFDTTRDLSAGLERFYEDYLGENLGVFGMPPAFAEGFYAMLELLARTPGDWAKGQVIGPISFGLAVTDQNLRASLYDDMLADVIVKNMAMQARWQTRLLRAHRPNVIMFVDEPYMASFGSAYLSLSREQAIAYMDEVFDAIHTEGALAGVHCCGNTDWSLLLDTRVDILNLDARGFIENLSLYPSALCRFLNRGGIVAWGSVPNDENALTATPESVARQLLEGLTQISRRAESQGVAIAPADFRNHSILTPSCGLGTVSEAVAARTLALMRPVKEILLANL